MHEILKGVNFDGFYHERVVDLEEHYLVIADSDYYETFIVYCNKNADDDDTEFLNSMLDSWREKKLSEDEGLEMFYTHLYVEGEKIGTNIFKTEEEMNNHIAEDEYHNHWDDSREIKEGWEETFHITTRNRKFGIYSDVVSESLKVFIQHLNFHMYDKYDFSFDVYPTLFDDRMTFNLYLGADEDDDDGFVQVWIQFSEDWDISKFLELCDSHKVEDHIQAVDLILEELGKSKLVEGLQFF